MTDCGLQSPFVMKWHNIIGFGVYHFLSFICSFYQWHSHRLISRANMIAFSFLLCLIHLLLCISRLKKPSWIFILLMSLVWWSHSFHVTLYSFGWNDSRCNYNCEEKAEHLDWNVVSLEAISHLQTVLKKFQTLMINSNLKQNVKSQQASTYIGCIPLKF